VSFWVAVSLGSILPGGAGGPFRRSGVCDRAIAVQDLLLARGLRLPGSGFLATDNLLRTEEFFSELVVL